MLDTLSYVERGANFRDKESVAVYKIGCRVFDSPPLSVEGLDCFDLGDGGGDAVGLLTWVLDGDEALPCSV